MSTAMTKKEDQRLEHVDQRPAVAPRVDVYENKDGLLLVADMPGVSSKGLDIQIDEEKLSIFGRVDDEPAADPLRREFRAFDYRRTFTVPDGIDRQKIGAELKNGVLRLTLPKAEAVKPRRIEVKAR